MIRTGGPRVHQVHTMSSLVADSMGQLRRSLSEQPTLLTPCAEPLGLPSLLRRAKGASSAGTPTMNRCPANAYGNAGPASPRSWTRGTAIPSGSTRATKSWTACSGPKRSAHHACRGNRNSHPSDVRNASNCHPDPMSCIDDASTFGNCSATAARASFRERDRSASHGRLLTSLGPRSGGG